jgi:hypothetical protein
MKRFRFLAFALLAIALWSGAADADLFYSATDSSNTKYGIIAGNAYDLRDNLRTGTHSYGQAFSFTDNKDKQWVVVDEYNYSDSAPDTIDIYDPYGDWSKPASERTDWGKNLYDLAVADNFLYIVAFERYEGTTQASGQIIRVNLDNGFAPDEVVYKFDPNTDTDPILRRPCAIEVIDGKLYVLTYTYDGDHSVYAGFGPSELFEFDQDLKFLRKTTIGDNDDLSARNAAFLAQYDGKLYVGSSGGALGTGNSVGAVWEINPSTLDAKKIVDLDDVLNDTAFEGADKGVSGISIAKDGTAYLLLGGYDTSYNFIARLYIATVNELVNGDVGTLAPESTGTGYAWGIVYDENLKTLWLTAGNQIEARDKDGVIKKTFAPGDLDGDAYKTAIIGGTGRYITPPPPPPDNGGGGCDTGVGAFVLLLVASAALFKSRKR